MEKIVSLDLYSKGRQCVPIGDALAKGRTSERLIMSAWI